MSQLSSRDWEYLSAYLDGELSGEERGKLEKKLDSDQEYRNALISLEVTHKMLNSLPRKKVPYHFTITRAMLPQRKRWALPLSIGFSLASVSSLALIVLSFAMQLLPKAAPAMQTFSEAAAPQAEILHDESSENAPLIYWGAPGSPIIQSGGGYGGGGAQQPYSGVGGGEVNSYSTTPSEETIQLQPTYVLSMDDTTAEEQPAQEMSLLPAEEAAPAEAKEPSSESIVILPTPVQGEVAEGENLALQAVDESDLARETASGDSPILGVQELKNDDDVISSAEGMSDSIDEQTLRTVSGIERQIIWVRLGLVSVLVISSIAAMYFIRKTRI